MWVPGHCGVPSSETVDGLAKKAANTSFVGPEPVFGMPICSMKTAARVWAHGERATVTVDRKLHLQTGQDFLKGPDLAVTSDALSLGRRDMHYLVALITGHVALNRHQKLVGIKDSSVCPL